MANSPIQNALIDKLLNRLKSLILDLQKGNITAQWDKELRLFEKEIKSLTKEQEKMLDERYRKWYSVFSKNKFKPENK